MPIMRPTKNEVVKRRFLRNLLRRLDATDLREYEIAQACGLSKAAFSQYRNGIALPGATALVNLSRIFECSVDDLLT